MKFFALAIVALATHPSAVHGAVEQCRFIEKKSERETCYARQAEALAAKNQAAAAKKTVQDPIRQMKLEDDGLSRHLRSICRGC